jgi:hypothetical protein
VIACDRRTRRSARDNCASASVWAAPCIGSSARPSLKIQAGFRLRAGYPPPASLGAVPASPGPTPSRFGEYRRHSPTLRSATRVGSPSLGLPLGDPGELFWLAGSTVAAKFLVSIAAGCDFLLSAAVSSASCPRIPSVRSSGNRDDWEPCWWSCSRTSTIWKSPGTQARTPKRADHATLARTRLARQRRSAQTEPRPRK